MNYILDHGYDTFVPPILPFLFCQLSLVVLFSSLLFLFLTLLDVLPSGSLQFFIFHFSLWEMFFWLWFGWSSEMFYVGWCYIVVVVVMVLGVHWFSLKGCVFSLCLDLVVIFEMYSLVVFSFEIVVIYWFNFFFGLIIEFGNGGWVGEWWIRFWVHRSIV